MSTFIAATFFTIYLGLGSAIAFHKAKTWREAIIVILLWPPLVFDGDSRK